MEKRGYGWVNFVHLLDVQEKTTIEGKFLIAQIGLHFIWGLLESRIRTILIYLINHSENLESRTWNYLYSNSILTHQLHYNCCNFDKYNSIESFFFPSQIIEKRKKKLIYMIEKFFPRIKFYPFILVYIFLPLQVHLMLQEQILMQV